MSEELWMEVHDIVQEAVIKTIHNKNKCKKVKWLSEEVLQIAEKRKDVKGRGEKEKYTHLKAALQKITRGDKIVSRGKNIILKVKVLVAQWCLTL